MTAVEKISRKIACLIDEEIKELGYQPESFYKQHRLAKKIWRIRSGRSFSHSGIQDIISLAQKGLVHGSRRTL